MGRAEQADKRMSSKIYAPHDNSQLGRFLMAAPSAVNPGEPRAGAVTPSKLIASPSNAGSTG